MILEVNIPDEAIKADDVDTEDVINLIESGIRYVARVASNYNIEEAEINISAK